MSYLFILLFSINLNAQDEPSNAGTTAFINSAITATQQGYGYFEERRKAQEDNKKAQEELKEELENFGVEVETFGKKMNKMRCVGYKKGSFTNYKKTTNETGAKGELGSCTNPEFKKATKDWINNFSGDNTVKSALVDLGASNNVLNLLKQRKESVASCSSLGELTCQDNTCSPENESSCLQPKKNCSNLTKVLARLDKLTKKLCNKCRALKHLNKTAAGLGQLGAALTTLGAGIAALAITKKISKNKQEKCIDACKGYTTEKAIQACYCSNDCLEQAICDELNKETANDDKDKKSIEEQCHEQLGGLKDEVEEAEYNKYFEMCKCQKRAEITGLAYKYNEEKEKCEDPTEGPQLPTATADIAKIKKKKDSKLKKGKGTRGAGGSGGLGSFANSGGGRSKRRKGKDSLRNLSIGSSGDRTSFANSRSAEYGRGKGSGTMSFKKKKKAKDIVSSKSKDSIFIIVSKHYKQKTKAWAFKI